jgi:hypothetical protein
MGRLRKRDYYPITRTDLMRAALSNESAKAAWSRLLEMEAGGKRPEAEYSPLGGYRVRDPDALGGPPFTT